jgi:hypothetical protein
MKNVRTWISRVSAVALVAVSVSVSAGALAPDFLVHKASVNLKTSVQSTDGIEKETIKTKQVINYLMGRYADLDGKNEKNEKLGLITGCSTVGLDTERLALAVYDSKEKHIKPLSDVLVFDIAEGKFERKNGELKKADIISFLEGFIDRGIGDDIDPIDLDIDFLSQTAQVKYGKIGNKVVKSQPIGNTWSKDTICAQNLKTKAITGFGDEFEGLEFFLRDRIVMSGKINAQRPQFGFNDPNFVPRASVFIDKDNGFDDNLLLEPGVINYTITVTNTGESVLTDVVVLDDQLNGEIGDPNILVCGNANGGFGDFNGILAPNASVVCKGDKLITLLEFGVLCDFENGIGDGFIRNVAAVTTNETGVQATANLTYMDCDFLNPPAGTLSIVKTAEEADIGIGIDGLITYAVVVKNTSATITLDNVVVADKLGGVVGPVCAATTLAPGAELGCAFTLTVVKEIWDEVCGFQEGIIRNVAAATADNIATWATDATVEIIDCVDID